MAAELAQPNPVTVGVDVGQIHDPSAVCVAEVTQEHTGKFRLDKRFHVPAHVDANLIFHKAIDADPVLRSEYTIRYIQRLPLGTSYPAVAAFLADLLCNDRFAHRDVRCLIDVTGVGRPVYDDLKDEINLRREVMYTHQTNVSGLVWKSGNDTTIHLKPITFSNGEKYNKTTGTLAKAFLVSRLQSLLQGERVHGPDTAEMKATVEELRVYEIKLDTDGKDTYGAIVGKHDDLATALGLACLEDPYSERVSYSQRVY